MPALTIIVKSVKIQPVIYMELLQLKYFCDAAETENFSLTAKKFEVPPSGISQTVKRLEEELGTELFIRGANRVSLNEQGRIFYGGGEKAETPLVIDNKHLILSAFRKAPEGELVRLYNSSAENQHCTMKFKDICVNEEFKPFEVKTFIKSDGKIKETDMLGR